MIWKSSQIGMHNLKEHKENQDSICYAQNNDFCVISLADGVSSCKEAKNGAVIASKAITNLFFQKGTFFFELEKKQTAAFVLSHIQFELKQYAEKAFKKAEDYSSTVASVFYDKRRKKILCFNLGDSIILSIGQGKCRVITMPDDSSTSCCVTTTKGAEKLVKIELIDVSDMVDAIVICSDGAWRQMYQKNRLRLEVLELLLSNNFGELTEFLNKQNCFDDYSFISMDIQKQSGRQSA